MSSDPDARLRSSLPRPVAQLFGDLTREAADVVHAELGEKIERARSGLQVMAAAGVAATAGAVMVLFALARLLAGALPPAVAAWAAPLAIGALALLAGWGLYQAARRSLDPRHLTPRRTIDTLGDDRRGGPHHEDGDPARAADGHAAAAELFDRHPLLIGGLGVVLGGVRSALRAHDGSRWPPMPDPRNDGFFHSTAHFMHAGLDEAEELVHGMTELASDAAERLLYGDDGGDEDGWPPPSMRHGIGRGDWLHG